MSDLSIEVPTALGALLGLAAAGLIAYAAARLVMRAIRRWRRARKESRLIVEIVDAMQREQDAVFDAMANEVVAKIEARRRAESEREGER